MTKSNVIYLISRIHEKSSKLIVQELKIHGMEGFAPSHGDIIATLYKNNEMTMKEMADLIGRDKSTITALVDKLINLGYLKKDADSKDGRVFRIKLTEKAMEKKADFQEISKILLSKAFQNLLPDEVDLLGKILDKINRNW